MPDRRATFLFAGICAACLVGIVLIAVWTRMHAVSELRESPSGHAQLHQRLDAERLYFRYTGMGPDYGRLAFLDDSVDFSTQTLLYDLVSLTPIADLETFTVVHGGETISRADFNFWGVTFLPDEQGFYATLSSAGEHHLVKGDIPSRTAIVIHDRVECPSVSPDGTRVAYKRRITMRGGVVGWNIRVLRLGDGQDIALADERSIDDPLEWLDNEHVLYSVPDKSSPAVTNVWTSRADGTGTAALFLDKAYSPAVVR